LLHGFIHSLIVELKVVIEVHIFVFVIEVKQSNLSNVLFCTSIVLIGHLQL